MLLFVYFCCLLQFLNIIHILVIYLIVMSDQGFLLDFNTSIYFLYNNYTTISRCKIENCVFFCPCGLLSFCFLLPLHFVTYLHVIFSFSKSTCFVCTSRINISVKKAKIIKKIYMRQKQYTQMVYSFCFTLIGKGKQNLASRHSVLGSLIKLGRLKKIINIF